MTLEKKAIMDGELPDGFEPIDIGFFQFQEPGDHITGRLVVKGNTRINGATVGKYTIQEIQDGKVKDVSFLGSVLLDEKLSRIPNGSNIFISYLGEIPTGDKGNKMKKFNVAVKKSN
jgi:hypothetical protein